MRFSSACIALTGTTCGHKPALNSNMVSFENDYSTGAHPEVLKRLCETNLKAAKGYGADEFSESAKKKIISALGTDDAEVWFLTGGTQTNAVVISTLLSDEEGVLSATTGHINAHESGAVEYTGHKVLTLPQKGGKISATELEAFLTGFYADETREHTVFPGMVYISHPTEYGTLYAKSELEDISSVCHRYGMKLFLDGARLGYALASPDTDVTMKDIATLCDVFYIGGTKVGALCGEAVVFMRGCCPKHFLSSVKKRGALLAKGRLLGVQFDALFSDGLYLSIGRHALITAEKMKAIFAERGIRPFIDSPTNQQFFILENERLDRLKEKVAFSVWEPFDETRTVVRFVTSWSTTENDLTELAAALDE